MIYKPNEVFNFSTKLYEFDSEDLIVLDSTFKNNIGHSISLNNRESGFVGYTPTPWHGRSHVIINSGLKKYLVIKGTGCPYLAQPYIHSGYDNHVWGLLEKNAARQEFSFMQKVSNIGIPTSNPIALKKISIGQFSPYLIYYSIRCPYRLIDLDFMAVHEKRKIGKNILNQYSGKHKLVHLAVMDQLSDYLKIFYSNGYIHNALSVHNITCELEIVDYESCVDWKSSSISNEEKSRLISREIVYLQEISFAVSWWFKEKFDQFGVQNILLEKHLSDFF